MHNIKQGNGDSRKLFVVKLTVTATICLAIVGVIACSASPEISSTLAGIITSALTCLWIVSGGYVGVQGVADTMTIRNLSLPQYAKKQETGSGSREDSGGPEDKDV